MTQLEETGSSREEAMAQVEAAAREDRSARVAAEEAARVSREEVAVYKKLCEGMKTEYAAEKAILQAKLTRTEVELSRKLTMSNALRGTCMGSRHT